MQFDGICEVSKAKPIEANEACVRCTYAEFPSFSFSPGGRGVPGPLPFQLLILNLHSIKKEQNPHPHTTRFSEDPDKMIVVIADDFTGAAEIAGIAWRFGLRAEVQTSFRWDSDLDVIIVDTHTRSKTGKEARKVLGQLLESLKVHRFHLLYKKTDSVLRGHVYDELSVLLEHYPESSVLLAPANPSKGRIISDGIYYIDEKPLHETIFAEDPEEKISTSEVSSLVCPDLPAEIKVLDKNEEIPQKRGMIYIAGAKNRREVALWTGRLKDPLIPAGAADFFKAILTAGGHPENTDVRKMIDFETRKSFFICGSSLSNIARLEKELELDNPAVVEISVESFFPEPDDSILSVVTKQLADHFNTTRHVILSVNVSKDSMVDLPTQSIPGFLARITSSVLKRIEPVEIIIEGGTTSSEVVRELGWSRFIPVSELGNGGIRMQVVENPDYHLTVKPGSYKW